MDWNVSTQVPPTKLVEDEKLAIAKQRQDRLDRERLERNIKYGLGVAGSVALTGLGLYSEREKIKLAYQKLYQGKNALEQQAANSSQRELTSLLNTGAGVLNASIRGGTAVTNTVINNPKTSGLGALVVSGLLLGPQLTGYAGSRVGEGVGLGGYKIGEGLVRGVGAGIVGTTIDLANAGYEWVLSPAGTYILKPIAGKTGDVYRAIYDRIKANSTEPVPSYKEWRKQFPSLRGQDPIYANTTGLQVPPQFIPDLSKTEFSNPKELYENFFVGPTQVFDLAELSGKDPRKWPQEVIDNIRSLPRNFVRNAFERSAMKSRPITRVTPTGSKLSSRVSNMQVLWDVYHEYYGPQ